jgi:hypothetical protein
MLLRRGGGRGPGRGTHAGKGLVAAVEGRGELALAEEGGEAAGEVGARALKEAVPAGGGGGAAAGREGGGGR